MNNAACLIAAALLAGAPAFAQSDVEPCRFIPNASVLAEICDCTKFDNNHIRRLQCFDDAVALAQLEHGRSRLIAEYLVRTPAGRAAMEEALKVESSK